MIKKKILPLLFILSFSLLGKTKRGDLELFCNKVNAKFQHFSWTRKIICNPKRWKTLGYTPQGAPLVYEEFFGKDSNEKTDLTLIFCAVHGDELPAVYFCIRMVRDIIYDNPSLYDHAKIVIAPLVNPDGFLSTPPQRTNGNGVDLNRNFPTRDWNSLALKLWNTRIKKNKRRFPGKNAGSETETIFQMKLIKKYSPTKILSIHTPYGFLDYDYGPHKKMSPTLVKAKNMAVKFSKKSNHFRVTDFKMFPGSLGNYAGNDQMIPTFTLELDFNNPYRCHKKWNEFAASLRYLITSQI